MLIILIFDSWICWFFCHFRNMLPRCHLKIHRKSWDSAVVCRNQCYQLWWRVFQHCSFFFNGHYSENVWCIWVPSSNALAISIFTRLSFHICIWGLIGTMEALILKLTSTLSDSLKISNAVMELRDYFLRLCPKWKYFWKGSARWNYARLWA